MYTLSYMELHHQMHCNIILIEKALRNEIRFFSPCPTQLRQRISYCSHQKQVKLFTAIFIRDLTLMEWPAQQKDKARKEGQKKRGGESEKKKHWKRWQRILQCSSTVWTIRINVEMKKQFSGHYHTERNSINTHLKRLRQWHCNNNAVALLFTRGLTD